MNTDKRIQISLFLLRLGVFVVMLMWTLDKFLNPAHAGSVFAFFYFMNDMSPLTLQLIGAVELCIILAFMAGFMKTFSYGFVLIVHLLSTLSSYKMYMDPFANLLFFAAWPMLAACFVLFYLRDLDTWLVASKTMSASRE